MNGDCVMSIQPDYTNKAIKPARVIVHKTCGKQARHIEGGRIWCDTCKRHVDAVECYHDEAKK